ncbi:MAG: response regulator [Terriglobia bacterium]
MRPAISALAVNEDATLWQHLGAVLQRQSVATRYARTCGEARRLLASEQTPEIVFTGVNFSDGTWRDVMAMARSAGPPPAVILVTRLDEIQLYLEAMNEGACDYIVPPFAAADVAHIVASALGQNAESPQHAGRLPFEPPLAPEPPWAIAAHAAGGHGFAPDRTRR